ncbi:MAG: hypothetical protein ACOX3V_04445 [Bacillota bacterium]
MSSEENLVNRIEELRKELCSSVGVTYDRLRFQAAGELSCSLDKLIYRWHVIRKKNQTSEGSGNGR